MDERGGSSQWSVSWIIPVSYSYSLYKKAKINLNQTLVLFYSVN